MIGILKSLHRNKLNTNKQGRKKLFYVVTKIPTQGRQVLSRQNRTRSRHKVELTVKVLSRHKKNLVVTENIYNTNVNVAT